jgi:hypothetical protein
MSIVFIIAINIQIIDTEKNKEHTNLNVLINTALASGGGGGGLECICVECPSNETGCWSYDYNIDECGGSNSGYTGSWQCKGAGWIEQHVID